jgi:ABC-type xylose transport system permease subunit
VITSHAVRKLLRLLYLAGALVLADQAADLAATLLSKPWMPSEANWRFGVFGLLMTRASVFLIGDVMLFSAAILLGHRKTLRSLGVLHLLLVLLLLAGIGLFALDWLQVRRQVGDNLRVVDLAGIRAAATALLLLLLVGWSGLAALRAGRATKHSHREGEHAPLLSAIRRDENVS